MATEKSSSKGQAWFCTTGLPSDIVIEIDEMTFHLHKFPLMSKSRKLHQLITEQETSNLTRRRSSSAASEQELQVVVPASELEDNNEDEIEPEQCHISLPDFPGGSETFEIAAKFCYGVKTEITSSNVAPLRCAGEYLEMTEDYSEENLISKTERFLTEVVFKNIKECIKTLKSCEMVMPMEETLQISERCIDAIAERASTNDPSLFGWPINDGSGGASATNQILWNGIETGNRFRKNTNTNTNTNTTNRVTKTDSWIEELCHLSLPLYQRLISAMKARDLSSEIIERSIMSYAKKSIPGLSRSSRKQLSTSSIASEVEQRELLESIVMNLPIEKKKKTSSSTTAKFLFGLLRTANILNASASCRAALEKKIALQLDQATLDDLLIPSYSYLIETLYDVDCVKRILAYFLQGLDEIRLMNEIDGDDGEEDGGGGGGGRSLRLNPIMLVGKLIDGYLSEIASDANLKPDKFCDLGDALPDEARLFDDGLYRAVDVYLKGHPWVSEEERERICGVMDYQKLTLEACTHAAQNERLPLRAVVQVLFFEQLQLRHAIAGTLLAADIGAPPLESARHSYLHQQQHHQQQGEEEEEEEEEGEEGNAGNVGVVGGQGNDTWRVAIRENQVLRLDMDSMRSRVQDLERECSSMKKTIEKMEKTGPGAGGWRNSLTKKFGCKFKTQVCDSHEPTVVESRRDRHRHRREASS